jgi:hypothetical protein
MKNTSEIVKEINSLRDEMKEDKIRSLTSRVNYFETIVGVRGLGIQPSYPVHAPMPYPQHAPLYDGSCA